MKKLLGLAAFITLTLTACQKDDPIPAPAPTPITIKYQVNMTAALKDTSVNAVIKYTDGNGTLQTATDFLPGMNSWSKTITVTNTTRPFPIEFRTVGTNNNYIYLTAPCNVSSSITINNSVGPYEISTSVNGPGYYFNNFALRDTLR